MMKNSLIALLLSLPLSAAAADGKVVSEQVKIGAGKEIHVAMDKGQLAVVPSGSGTLTYRVEFVPERGRSLLKLLHIGNPSAADYERSSASFDAATGTLAIRTGEHLKAIVKIGVPVKQPLDLNLTVGAAEIGPLSGKVKAFVATGDLKYDASALAAGVCVSAALRLGEVRNSRDVDCKSVGTTLRGNLGTISVN